MLTLMLMLTLTLTLTLTLSAVLACWLVASALAGRMGGGSMLDDPAARCVSIHPASCRLLAERDAEVVRLGEEALPRPL